MESGVEDDGAQGPAAGPCKANPGRDSRRSYQASTAGRLACAMGAARQRCADKPRRYGLPRSAGEQQCENQIVRWNTGRQELTLRAERIGGAGMGVVAVLTALLLLVGTTFVGHDWNSGSMSNQLLFEARRGRVWAAKAVAVGARVSTCSLTFRRPAPKRGRPRSRNTIIAAKPAIAVLINGASMSRAMAAACEAPDARRRLRSNGKAGNSFSRPFSCDGSQTAESNLAPRITGLPSGR